MRESKDFKKKPQFIDLSMDELLNYAESHDNVNVSEIENVIINMKKDKVKEVHRTSFYQRKDGRYFTKVKEDGQDKQIIAQNENELYIKLYEFYFGKSNLSLEDFFTDWINWRNTETGVTKKTIIENKTLWKTVLKNAPIVKAPMRQLKPLHFIEFFRSITRDKNITRKRFNDIKSVLSGMLYRAIEIGIIDRNYLKDINYRLFSYKPENTKKIPYI